MKANIMLFSFVIYTANDHIVGMVAACDDKAATKALHNHYRYYEEKWGFDEISVKPINTITSVEAKPNAVIEFYHGS